MKIIDQLCLEVENIFLKARLKQLEKRIAKLEAQVKNDGDQSERPCT